MIKMMFGGFGTLRRYTAHAPAARHRSRPVRCACRGPADQISAFGFFGPLRRRAFGRFGRFSWLGRLRSLCGFGGLASFGSPGRPSRRTRCLNRVSFDVDGEAVRDLAAGWSGKGRGRRNVSSDDLRFAYLETQEAEVQMVIAFERQAA